MRTVSSISSGYRNLFALSLFAIEALGSATRANSPADRTIPGRVVPVPDTISPVLQDFSLKPASHRPVPTSVEEWRLLGKQTQLTQRELADLSEKFGVRIGRQEIGGVPCQIVTPLDLSAKNRDCYVLALHGGGYVFKGGDGGLPAAAVLAAITGYRVVSIDYRMPPDHPFPAAVDDVVNVWTQLAKSSRPDSLAVFGTSAGGGLALSFVQRCIREGLPRVGAVVCLSPWSDLSKTGDSYYTNEGVDSTLSYDGFLEASARLYADGRSLKDPGLSPVYGNFAEFPPTFLMSGTRDLFLSNTVRVQRKLLQAGVPTVLEIQEAQSHGEYLSGAMANAPESLELFTHIKDFLNEHLRH